MINNLIKNNYIIVDNFISNKKAKKLYDEFKMFIKLNPNNIYYDDQCPKSLSFYNYKEFVKLLVQKTSFLNKLLKEELLPTYAYARIYSNNEILYKHKDRPACEISVTLNLGGDKDWEIFFTKPNQKIASAILKPGQAIIYMGCISEHWRNSFEGNEYGQVFLHYVRANGPYWDHYFDKYNK